MSEELPVRAGRLARWGRVYHAVRADSMGAVCGFIPRQRDPYWQVNSRHGPDGSLNHVTCPRCRRLLALETTP